MLVQLLKSKIHRVKVTEANLNYVGSITIDKTLMDAAGFFEGEHVFIVDNNNGERFETYAIPGESNSGQICLNGAAARKVLPGDIIIIMAYGMIEEKEIGTFRPKVIFPDTETNKLV